MVNVLIVDDEFPALMSIRMRVDWDKLGVATVFTASGAHQAKEVITENSVQIALIDVEMPGESGLQLLQWISAHHPQTVSAMLTCHDSFQYAQRAISMGCSDYLLKPIDADTLAAFIQKAVGIVGRQIEMDQFVRMGMAWKQNMHLLVRSFWRDVLSGTLAPGLAAIQAIINERDLPLRADMQVIPALIKMQPHVGEPGAPDERQLMEMICGFCSDLLVQGADNGIAMLWPGRLLVVVRYAREGFSMQDLRQLCKELIAVTSNYVGCDLTCFASGSVGLDRLQDSFTRLMNYSRNNLSARNQVAIIIGESEGCAPFVVPDAEEWSNLLAEGRMDAACELASTYLAQYENTNLSPVSLHAFKESYMQALFVFMRSCSIPASWLFDDTSSRELDLRASDSLSDLIMFIRHITEKLAALLREPEYTKPVVAKAKDYIQMNIDRDCSRIDVARHVFLNADYLSRVFKRETGLSLSEYIVREKLSLAQKLLVSTDIPISAIASRLGYSSFSHFTKAFKKQHNRTPSECRSGRNG